MYQFRDERVKEWKLNLLIARNEEKLKEGMGPSQGSKLDCCNELKTNALKLIIRNHGLKAILWGIRRDEHGLRAKGRYFSTRDTQFKWDYENQPAELWDQYQSIVEEEEHFRIHHILHSTEFDVWSYVKREGLPIVPLYFSKNGKRFRSIGCVPCCAPIDLNAQTIDEKTSWFDGPTVLQALDTFEELKIEEKPLRFPVQDIYSMDGQRILVGRIEAGHLMRGKEIFLRPKRKWLRLKRSKNSSRMM